MISLNVEDYCQSCLYFIPEVTKPRKYRALDCSLYFQTDAIIGVSNNVNYYMEFIEHPFIHKKFNMKGD